MPRPALPLAPAFTVRAGLRLEVIAEVSSPRQLAALPNGDLLVGTLDTTVYVVPNADSTSAPGAPVVFTRISDEPAQGVAFDASSCTIYVGGKHGIYAMAYTDGQLSAASGEAIARVRASDDGHTTTSVAFASGALYAGIGSSCDACAEVDPTRATIQRIDRNKGSSNARAIRFRNPIALTANPDTGTLWAGNAGQSGQTDQAWISGCFEGRTSLRFATKSGRSRPR